MHTFKFFLMRGEEWWLLFDSPVNQLVGHLWIRDAIPEHGPFRIGPASFTPLKVPTGKNRKMQNITTAVQQIFAITWNLKINSWIHGMGVKDSTSQPLKGLLY